MNANFRSQIAAAIDACVGIVRFRKGPEDVPASRPVLFAAIAGGVLLRFLMQALPAGETDGNPAVLIGLEIGISLLCLMLALRGAGHPERFLQTSSAFFGSQLVMAPALIGSRWLLLSFYEQPGIGVLVRFFYIAVALWMLAVTSRILRSATQWPMFVCVALALTIEALTLLAALSLYPPPEGEAAAA